MLLTTSKKENKQDQLYFLDSLKCLGSPLFQIALKRQKALHRFKSFPDGLIGLLLVAVLQLVRAVVAQKEVGQIHSLVNQKMCLLIIISFHKNHF